MGSVEQLIADVGLHPVWVGGTDQVGTVDGVPSPLVHAVGQRGRRIAFKLLAD